ncbi:MAG: tetratricopeptide repeat protein [Hydrogenophaga sp.]|nr:tetratricopeptide repeat protein [Hydrogenophaga sp.]
MKEALQGWLCRTTVRTLLTFGWSSQARERIRHRLVKVPDDAYALATQAHLQSQQGDKSEAIRTLQHLVDVHPGLSSAWFNLGFLLDQAEEPARAEAAFQRALEIEPSMDRAWYGLGLSLICQNRLDEAINALRRNTELQPLSPYGWYQLARVHAERQDDGEVQRIIDRLRQFEPKFAAQLTREVGIGATVS